MALTILDIQIRCHANSSAGKSSPTTGKAPGGGWNDSEIEMLEAAIVEELETSSSGTEGGDYRSRKEIKNSFVEKTNELFGENHSDLRKFDHAHGNRHNDTSMPSSLFNFQRYFEGSTAGHTTGRRTNLDEEGPKRVQILYRYFGRGRARRRIDTSIPFILLGGNIDHWTKLGEALSKKGFNAIACEFPANSTSFDSSERMLGNELVSTILDALRWRRAIVVGCDTCGAISTLEAANYLAPDKVLGVMLCGNFEGIQRYLLHEMEFDFDPKHHRMLDEYLLRHVDCPSGIISDGNTLKRKQGFGETSELMFMSEDYDNLRCVILGGGEAPHRRTPEQLSWVLARFVEEKIVGLSGVNISTPTKKLVHRDSSTFRKNHLDSLDTLSSSMYLTLLDLKETMLSPQSVLVSGRLIAYALLYIACGKAIVTQYRSIQNAFSAIQVSCNYLKKWQKQIRSFLFSEWTRKLGIVFFPFRFTFKPLRRSRSRDAFQDSPEFTTSMIDEKGNGSKDSGINTEDKYELTTPTIDDKGNDPYPDDMEDEKINEKEFVPFYFEFGTFSV